MFGHYTDAGEIVSKMCPHCGRGGCRSCSTRATVLQPTRDDPAYWRKGTHYPDHSGAGLYGNGIASEGPEDFGAATWAIQAERMWEEETAYTVDQADALRQWQQRDGQHRLVEHLATSPEVVTLLRTFLMLGAFTKSQRVRVKHLLREASEARAKLLQENSILAAVLRSRKAKAA